MSLAPWGGSLATLGQLKLHYPPSADPGLTLASGRFEGSPRAGKLTSERPPPGRSALILESEFPVTIDIVAFEPRHEAALIDLSLRAWAPVFQKLEPAVQPYVFQNFYPQGWAARQTADIREFLRAEGERAFVAVEKDLVLGWVGVRLHPHDRMGEIYILAVDPACQGRGVATALMNHAMAVMLRAGLAMVMVETGDDPGHAPSRATYESAGFERWPVARYFRQLTPTETID